MQHLRGPSAVLDLASGDDHQPHQAKCIYAQMPLTSGALRAGVIPACRTTFDGCHALTIQHGRAGLSLTSTLCAHGFTQRGIQAFPRTIHPPPPEVWVDRLPRWQVMRQPAPGTPAAQKVKNAVHDVMRGKLPWPIRALLSRPLWRYQGPFVSMQVCRVGLAGCGHSTRVPDGVVLRHF